MFNTENVIGVYRNNGMMETRLGLHSTVGKLVGILFFWPLIAQPTTVEWAAAVAFLSNDPEEVYFVCDIVHGLLMKWVAESRKRNRLSDRNTIPDDVIAAQAEKAHNILIELAQTNRLYVTASATLGVTQTKSGRVMHMNHFYSLRGEKPNSLILTAMKFDPQIAA
jgi:hypothetical protein